MCNESETGALSYDKFYVANDSDDCNLKFNAYHNAGCGMQRASGINQIFSLPWLTATCLMTAGIAACFFGGRLMDYINIILPVISSIGIAIVLLSNLGMLSVLEEDNETTALGIINAIACVAIITALAIFVCKMSRTNIGEKIGAATRGGIAGFILGELSLAII
jgi:hypothetical protein